LLAARLRLTSASSCPPAVLGRLCRLLQVTVDTVLSPEVTGVNECIFLYNPEDPYINPADVGMVIDE